jgi:sugar phosphate isomerase/epimerase
MTGRWQFGFDQKDPVEDGIAHAVAVGMDFVEFNADTGPNGLATFDAARIAKLRTTAEQHGVVLALHTGSGVNTADDVPFFTRAVDEYLAAYVDLASALDCGWVIVHGGFHFGTRISERFDAALEHLEHAADLAERKDVLLLLENHNREPDDAEMHYIPYTAEQQRWFMDRLPSPALGWSLNTGHANLVADGVMGYLAELGTDRLGQLRLCDSRGTVEEHLPPGEGTIDFEQMFRELERNGWAGPCIMSFGPDEARIAARDRFARALDGRGRSTVQS